jgi:catechol 2,3-dioxygenase-like lactoylglutathione lyase family enzyme
MAIGTTAFIALSARDFDASLAFYEQANFTLLDQGTEPDRWAMLQDGALRLLIHEGRFKGIGYLTAHRDDSGKITQEASVKWEEIAYQIGPYSGFAFMAPGEVPVCVLHAPSESWPKLPSISESRFGKFYEVSIEVPDFELARAFWEQLGFKQIWKGEKWGGFSDEVINIGIYEKGVCPHTFRNPAITYFNPDALDRLQKLKMNGYQYAQELPNREGELKDAILETPEGAHLFLFAG